MIGSDETTDFIRKWADAHNERDMESILSMEKADIKIELIRWNSETPMV